CRAADNTPIGRQRGGPKRNRHNTKVCGRRRPVRNNRRCVCRGCPGSPDSNQTIRPALPATSRHWKKLRESPGTSDLHSTGYTTSDRPVLHAGGKQHGLGQVRAHPVTWECVSRLADSSISHLSYPLTPPAVRPEV